MAASATSSTSGFALSEGTDDSAIHADWIGRLILLGSRAAWWSRTRPDEQLIIVVSVPVRDFAAVLIGCGWQMAAPSPAVAPVMDVVASLDVGTYVRVVTATKVLTQKFQGFNVGSNRMKLNVEWMIDKLKAIAPVDHNGSDREQSLASPGIISIKAGFADTWVERLCKPTGDLALVGALKWLREEMAYNLGADEEREPIANIIWPEDPKAATWSTRLYAATKLEDVTLPDDIRAVVLDGASAAKYLRTFESKVAFVVLDRSVADDSAAELVIEYRNTRGNDVSLKDGLKWLPSGGIEAHAFTVAL